MGRDKQLTNRLPWVNKPLFGPSSSSRVVAPARQQLDVTPVEPTDIPFFHSSYTRSTPYSVVYERGPCRWNPYNIVWTIMPPLLHHVILAANKPDPTRDEKVSCYRDFQCIFSNASRLSSRPRRLGTSLPY